MDPYLPQELSERLRWIGGSMSHDPGHGDSDGTGKFVLYWMHHALRADENPALDVAICLARQHCLPLLVYHALGEDYPYASDRLHAFVLQGHRDVARSLRDRGIQSYFHLERDGHRGPHLRDLTRQAAVLVSEEMPVQPVSGWIEQLTLQTSTPIAIVDTSCVVPAPLIKQAYTRAFRFRDATKDLFAQRVGRDYVAQQPADCEIYDGGLPFQPLDLSDHSLAPLIGQCRIDHGVAPVLDTPGGSAAGYARWDEFKEHGLDRYSRRRNDAAVHDGVSRLSPYLHYGMISPLRIAREARERGADKFLDELLIWRELAFHFCRHCTCQLDSLDAIPDWAQQTLAQHADDPRPGDYSWERLARGKTGQDLWDACQRSLLKHGELHNNVRMTWGKALLSWTPSPARALELTIDLNHRYALDGRDPSSYGGILWCFGQFDRPFQPSRPILGSVRPRSCEDHQQRIDMAKYLRVVDRPIAEGLPRVAVIGAGLAGLMAARTLADHGIDVCVLEKSRGVGGRLATRRTSAGVTFDHGAQYFTARDDRFCRYVQSWIRDGLVQPWRGRIVELKAGGDVVEEKLGTERFVGVPGMNAVARHLAADLPLHLETTVSRLQRRSDGPWQVYDREDRSLGEFDVLIANCPPPQTHALLSGHSHLAARTAQVFMRPCWAVMLSADGLEGLGFDGAFINQGPLSWIARNDSKPERHSSDNETTWIVHASADWSQQHLDSPEDEVRRELLDALQAATGQAIGKTVDAMVHRWRYALPSNPLPEECLWDAEAGLGACGDWCGGPRVEGAILSGMAMAGELLRHLTIDQPADRATSGRIFASRIPS